MPDEDRHTYAEGVKRGGYLLSARVPDGLQDAAADILEACDPIDLDQRSETWRQEGWTGYEASADAPAKAAYGEGAGLTEAGAAFESEDDHGHCPARLWRGCWCAASDRAQGYGHQCRR